MYSTVMSLFSVYRVYAFVAFSPFLLSGISLLLLGPAVGAVVRRSEGPVEWPPGVPAAVSEGDCVSERMNAPGLAALRVGAGTLATNAAGWNICQAPCTVSPVL